MDSAVLVTMPQAWGVNASHAASSHPYIDSSTSSHSSRHSGVNSIPAQHNSSSSNHGVVQPNFNTAAPTMQQAASVATARSLSAATNSNSSSSAFADVSAPWVTTGDDLEAALPGSQLLYEHMDVGRRASYRDQHHVPSSAQTVPALPRYAASYHRTAIPIPAAPALASRSRSTGSSSSNSSSSSPTRFQRLQRHSSSTSGFLSATASQLLGALSGISLISGSPAGSTGDSSSSSTGRRTHRVRVRSSPFGVRHSIRSSLLVRAPALLDLDSSESYDDLLALDQFNVKRAVKPSVLAALPTRGPNAQDEQLQRHCFICLEMWQARSQEGKLAAAAAAAAAGTAPDQDLCAGCSCSCQQISAAAGTSSRRACDTVAAAETAYVRGGGAVAAVAAAVRGRQQQQQQQVDSTVSQGPHGTVPASLFEAHAATETAAADTADTCYDRSSSTAAGTAGTCSRCSRDTAKPSAGPIKPHTAHIPNTGSSGNSSFISSPQVKSQQLQPQKQLQQCDVLIEELPCGHEFCARCICTWLKEHATCPVCRWAFPDEQTQLINMGK